MLKNRVGRFTFHHTFMSKLTGKTNHNEKHNWLRMERYRAWRDMYKPENSAAAYEKAILGAQKNGGPRASCGESIRAKSKKKRLRKLGSGIVVDKKEI
jgi:cytosine/adenosine deaminase-related metal-dependent hydrolase